MAIALAAAGLGAFAPSAGAAEEAVTFAGGPLTVSIGPLGQCQSSYANHGNNFYPPGGNLGDCGFFLAFPRPEGVKFLGQPKDLEGTTWGFEGSAGPHVGLTEGGNIYVPISQSAVSGSGTAASPYTQTTVFKVTAGAKDYAVITEVTTYVSGEPQFVSTFTVKNALSKKGEKIFFRAIYAGDLFVSGEDFGTGVFLGGPPRFIGGLNTSAGVLGGFVEAGAPSPPWSAFQEACWNQTPEGRCSGAAPTDNGIWRDVRSTVEEPTAFNNSVESAFVDNGTGVEWDHLREAGLEAGHEAAFTIINRTQVPSSLQISPANQTLTQGQTETITVTATDLAGIPYAGKVAHYTVAGSNSQSGVVTLNAAGQAQISYVGNNAGIDTIKVFVDLAGSGVQTPGDPNGTASVTFLPPPPAPNSSYRVQSVKANSDGTITVTFVPVQGGTGTLEVIVPTGSISRHQAAILAKKKCKKGQVKIKRKCRPRFTLSGRVSATGIAGVPLTLTVKSSKKVKNALKKGRTLHLTATLTYKSALGGTPAVTTFHVTVKGKKRHKKH